MDYSIVYGKNEAGNYELLEYNSKRYRLNYDFDKLDLLPKWVDYDCPLYCIMVMNNLRNEPYDSANAWDFEYRYNYFCVSFPDVDHKSALEYLQMPSGSLDHLRAQAHAAIRLPGSGW